MIRKFSIIFIVSKVSWSRRLDWRQWENELLDSGIENLSLYDVLVNMQNSVYFSVCLVLAVQTLNSFLIHLRVLLEELLGFFV